MPMHSPIPFVGYYPEGAPHPSWIDCIEVEKVLGSCQKTVTAYGADVPPLSCTALTMVRCEIPSCTLLNSVGCTNDFATMSWLVTIPVHYTCDTGSGMINVTAPVLTTIYNPPGTNPACIPFSASCGANIFNGVVYAAVTLCLELKTLAQVQLIVPTYSYCQGSPGE